MSDATVLQATLSISGASCQGCVKKIRTALEPLTGDTERVEVDLENQTVALPEGVDAAEAARIVTATGYPAEPVEEAPKPAPEGNQAEPAGAENGQIHRWRAPVMAPV